MVGELTKKAGIEGSALLEVTGKSPATQSAYRRAAGAFIEWAGGRKLSAHLFAEWIEEERKAVSSSKLRVELFGGKAAIMQAAVKAGIPASELAVLKTGLDSIQAEQAPPPQIKVVDGRERAAILKELSPRLALVFRFLYTTAARVSEALGVRQGDVKIEGERARVRLHGKGRKERFVYIPLDLLAEINEEFRSPRRVYLLESSYGKPYCRQYISWAISKAAKVAIGRPVSAHDLRHSRATDLFAKSKNLPGVSKLLGHSSTAVTAMYYVRTELSEDELKEEAL